jgi:hypothetical protein
MTGGTPPVMCKEFASRIDAARIGMARLGRGSAGSTGPSTAAVQARQTPRRSPVQAAPGRLRNEERRDRGAPCDISARPLPLVALRLSGSKCCEVATRSRHCAASVRVTLTVPYRLVLGSCPTATNGPRGVPARAQPKSTCGSRCSSRVQLSSPSSHTIRYLLSYRIGMVWYPTQYDYLLHQRTQRRARAPCPPARPHPQASGANRTRASCTRAPCTEQQRA